MTVIIAIAWLEVGISKCVLFFAIQNVTTLGLGERKLVFIVTQSECSAEGRSSTTKSGTKAAVLPGMNRCGSFPMLSAPHSLFSIWIDLKKEKIPGAPTWRWGEWIWLTGPSGLSRNLPQDLNISSIRFFDQIRDPEIPITFLPL